ncbi:MAG: right-handed parallel beta-helix repeat-containing protein [Anaerolineaceae bacterium]|nr:right-handed parallel beta-helix repeat-containing protein [Anaerolineaceae bacterium]
MIHVRVLLLSVILAILFFTACSPETEPVPLDSSEPALAEDAVSPTPRATATPTPTPTLTPTVPAPTTVHVSSDGSGDFETLEAAIAAVIPDSTIMLSSGTFILSEALTLEKPLAIVGEDRARTEIVSAASPYMIRYTGNGVFSLSGITLRHTEGEGANVLEVEGGSIEFSDCRITGGLSDDNSPGNGIVVRNTVSGTIKNCVIEKNDGAGIALTDQVQLTLEDNVCSENYIGILFSGSSAGTVKDNRCLSNHVGFLVRDSAAPLLVRNTANNNEQTGLLYEVNESGGGEANGNFLQNNAAGPFGLGTDIFIIGPYAPALTENKCSRENLTSDSPFGDSSGIVFFSDDELPVTPILNNNSCSVVWCTGTPFNAACREDN